MKYLRPVCFVLASTLMMHAQAHVDDATRSAIAAGEATWVANLDAGKLDALAAMYEPDAWLVVPGAEAFQGRDAIRIALGVLKANTQHMALKTVSVDLLAKDYVIENGVAETVAPNAPAKMQANYQVLWHRTAHGDWQIVRDMVSPK